MFWLWLIIAIVLFAHCTYCIGRLDPNGGDPVGLFWLCFLCSVFWPAVIVAAIIVGPFFGLFWLGNRKREKIEAAAKDK